MPPAVPNPIPSEEAEIGEKTTTAKNPVIAEDSSVSPMALRRPCSRTTGPQRINADETTRSRNSRNVSIRADGMGATGQDPMTSPPVVDTAPDPHRGGGPSATRGPTTKDGSRDPRRETDVKQPAILN